MPNTTGSLSFTPVPNANGTAMITVTVMDNGGVATAASIPSRKPSGHRLGGQPGAQTLATISNPAPILENAGQQTVSLSGISDGDNGTQNLTVTALSSNPGVVPNPTVTFTDIPPGQPDRDAHLHAGGQRQRLGRDHRDRHG